MLNETMNPYYRLKRLTAIPSYLFAITLLAGCAGAHGPYNRGVHAERQRDYETAMADYKAALDRDPGNIDYRMKYEQSRFQAAFTHYENGRRAFDKEDIETAKREFQRAVELDPTNDMAAQQLQKIKDIEESRQRKE